MRPNIFMSTLPNWLNQKLSRGDPNFMTVQYRKKWKIINSLSQKSQFRDSSLLLSAVFVRPVLSFLRMGWCVFFWGGSLSGRWWLFWLLRNKDVDFCVRFHGAFKMKFIYMAHYACYNPWTCFSFEYIVDWHQLRQLARRFRIDPQIVRGPWLVKPTTCAEFFPLIR